MGRVKASEQPTNEVQRLDWEALRPLLHVPRVWSGPWWYPHVRQPLWTRNTVRVLASLEVPPGESRTWLHVSASRAGGTQLPTWEDLGRVRRAFFPDAAVVVQVFPPVAEHVDIAEVLHLWQRLGDDRLVPDLRQMEPWLGVKAI